MQIHILATSSIHCRRCRRWLSSLMQAKWYLFDGFSTVISRIFSLREVAEIFINLFVSLLFSDGEVDSNPAQYREIQVNQLSEASEAPGFLPPIQTTEMYSMVH